MKLVSVKVHATAWISDQLMADEFVRDAFLRQLIKDAADGPGPVLFEVVDPKVLEILGKGEAEAAGEWKP